MGALAQALLNDDQLDAAMKEYRELQTPILTIPAR